MSEVPDQSGTIDSIKTGLERLWGEKPVLTGAALGEMMKNNVEAYLSALLIRGSIEPQVQVASTEEGSCVVDCKIPINRIPRDCLTETHTYLLICPRPGHMSRALQSVPEELRGHYVQVALSSMRGWYLHSHKGRKLRKHRLKNPVWAIKTGVEYQLRRLKK